MLWTTSHRADQVARKIADHHYNRQKPGTPQFVPPGRCLVLLIRGRRKAKALWVSAWPKKKYVQHAWAGAWVNSCFRNEGAGLSSDLIVQAVAVTRSVWKPPRLGFVSFIDTTKIKHKRDPGRCYVRAGWTRLKKRTKAGLVVMQVLPKDMPEPELPLFGIPSKHFGPPDTDDGEKRAEALIFVRRA